jgi:TusA-related sulfurtransferase
VDHLLDVSDLPPPEPLERTLDALIGLPPGDRLLLCIPRQPFPLFDLLRRMGYRWVVTGEEGGWRILIEPGAAAGTS